MATVNKSHQCVLCFLRDTLSDSFSVCMYVHMFMYRVCMPVCPKFISLSRCITCSVDCSNYLNISLSCLPGNSSQKKKLHFTSTAADLSWQDIIGLQSSFHRKFNTWYTSAWVGQACRWRWRWSRTSLLLIIVCGICKGHLQEALDMTSSGSICIPWLLCGLNITDAFQTTGATVRFSEEAAKVTHTGKKKKNISAIVLILFLRCPRSLLQGREGHLLARVLAFTEK